MNAAPTFATWHEYSPGHFSVTVAPNASYGVHRKGGSGYIVVIPGQRIRDCWNRKQVERVCIDAYEQMMSAPDEDERDEEAEHREYVAHLAWQRDVTPGRV